MTSPTAASFDSETSNLAVALQAGKKVPPDVTQLLADDHRTVLGWFRWYEATTDLAVRRQLVQRICMAIRAHMAAEEEFLYPAVARTQTGAPTAERALAEHAQAKKLIDELEADPDEAAATDRLVAKLRSEIEAHVTEEETELFPLAQRASIDLYALGCAVAAQRVETLLELQSRSAVGRKSTRGDVSRKSAKARRSKRSSSSRSDG
ncbi:MAG TPA: hemerythrin domain-containing protein [Gammaproteobacteria bacterium]